MFSVFIQFLYFSLNFSKSLKEHNDKVLCFNSILWQKNEVVIEIGLVFNGKIIFKFTFRTLQIQIVRFLSIILCV